MGNSRKKKRARRAGAKFHLPPKDVQTVEYLLEQGTLQEMRAAKAFNLRELRYQWDFYSELAHQRNQIQEQLKEALISASSSFQFPKWQRAVKWKYGLHPLSTVGSLTYIGGRFNTGVDVNSAVPSFPGLYLAIDKDTALQETLGQTSQSNAFGMTARELALSNPQSEVIVSVSGELEKVFDLRDHNNLKGFVELVKGFKLSEQLKQMAVELGFAVPGVVMNSRDLLSTIMNESWRENPSRFDVPANSQIFGHLLFQAGIEGVLYPSVLSGKDCLCIYPRNFASTSSFITFDDEPPSAKIPKRVDGSNWRVCDLTSEEMLRDLH